MVSIKFGLFLIQVLKKLDMLWKNDIDRILAERNILITVRNPFVVMSNSLFNITYTGILGRESNTRTLSFSAYLIFYRISRSLENWMLMNTLISMKLEYVDNLKCLGIVKHSRNLSCCRFDSFIRLPVETTSIWLWNISMVEIYTLCSKKLFASKNLLLVPTLQNWYSWNNIIIMFWASEHLYKQRLAYFRSLHWNIFILLE